MISQSPRRHRVAPAGLVCALLAAAGALADEAPHRRFLLLYSQDSALAANVEATAGLDAIFNQALGADYEVYAEYRDAQRFPGAEENRRFAERIARRYGGQIFDAILAFGNWALDYAVANRVALGIDAPVVYGGVGDAALAGIELPGDVHGVSSAFSIAGTVALARRLQPEARRVVVMTGSQAFDGWWERQARVALAGTEVDFVSGLTLEGFQEVAAGLDPDTILLILTIYEDAAGRQFTPVNAAELIAGGSAAPSWAVYDTFVGRGVVGGEVQRFRDVGAAMAEQALKLAEGDGAVAPKREVPARPVVDWRALRRFGLDPRLLPANAVLEFYDPSFWERYRNEVLLAAALFFLQSATIAALVVQDRRRRTAEREVAERRIELTHISRVAQLGELSGALAHELNQPLTSILANAEAGAELAARDPADLAEIAAILADIAEDDRRAAGIIVELRRLITKAEAPVEAVDLNAVVETTIRLARSEFLVRQVEIERRLARGELAVRGSRAQLKQVVLNLLVNAADAVAGQPEAMRRIVVATRARPDGWREMTVEDRGPGLAPEVAADPFRPFATTKPEGLGLGLSICRTIVQAHGGTLEFEADRKEGAMAILALPPA